MTVKNGDNLDSHFLLKLSILAMESKKTESIKDFQKVLELLMHIH